jgi:metal-responsive CopG/Arc/MetJ family transcriptional regulator
MTKRRYARIAITLPESDLAAADRLAQAQDRPRSWVIAEAIRQYAARAAETGMPTGSRATVNVGLGESRRRQLIADLGLTVEERIRAAEETARATLSSRTIRAQRILAFERYEDYLEWKKLPRES